MSNSIFIKTNSSCGKCPDDYIYKKLAMKEKGLMVFLFKVFGPEVATPKINESFMCLSCGTIYDPELLSIDIDREEEIRVRSLFLYTEMRTFRIDANLLLAFKPESLTERDCKLIEFELTGTGFPVRIHPNGWSYKKAVRGSMILKSKKDDKLWHLLGYITKYFGGGYDPFWKDESQDWLMEVYGVWDNYNKPVLIPRSSFNEEKIESPDRIYYFEPEACS